MKEFLFEMHAHNREISRCARATAEELVEEYVRLGYDGIVSTNHLNPHTFTAKRFGDFSWEQKAEIFIEGFKQIKELAGDRLTVLFGMDICFYDEPNDYLVYGVTEDFIRNNGDLMSLTSEQFSSLAHKNNMLFIQAHPFRRDMLIADWDILDGYEVFNGNPRHISSNEIAEEWAKLHGKGIITSGSDFHCIEDAGIGGMYFGTPITSNDDLIAALKSGNYRLKKH